MAVGDLAFYYTLYLWCVVEVPIKVVCSHCILIPRAQPEEVLFCVSSESPYFSYFNPIFQLEIHYTLAVKAENVQISSISILIF